MDEEKVTPSPAEETVVTAAAEPAAPPPTEQTASAEAAAAPAPAPKKLNVFDKFFGITASGSTFKAEIIAGLTTFMAMVYILMVNAGIFTAWIYDDAGQPLFQIIPDLTYGAMYIATAIGAIAGTLLMALLAKMPLAQASGMGVNAFVVYTLVLTSGLTYANAMVLTLLDGVIFVILTATGLRKKIFEAIPVAVRHAIPVGIGLFIAFIGMQNAGVIKGNSSTLVEFVSFNLMADGFTYGAIVAPLVALLGVIAIAIMAKKNVKGNILWGILGSAALYYCLTALGLAWGDATCKAVFTKIGETFSFNPFGAFADWGTQSVGQVFANGFDFSHYLSSHSGWSLAGVIFASALSLCMVDMFDTIGTLYGACSKGNLLDENGAPKNMNKMMLCDAIGTCVGAVAGTSTVTTFVESSAGVSAGGKTGFTALITAACFFVAMFLSPIAQLIPSAATASALIWVGVLMMGSVTKIDWSDAAEAIVAFFTFIIMVLGYSISKGIGIGIIAFVLVKLCTGKVKEISVVTWVLAALFIATFLVSSM
ncbi:MAG: NCS2 family permease [Clostridia bacterium]|nr:NCS2 family permease [Clostridia bacterium]